MQVFFIQNDSVSVKPFSASCIMASNALPSSVPNIRTTMLLFCATPSMSMESKLLALPSISPFTRVISEENCDAVSARSFAGRACNPPTHVISIVRSIIIFAPLAYYQAFVLSEYNVYIIQHYSSQFKCFKSFFEKFLKNMLIWDMFFTNFVDKDAFSLYHMQVKDG